MKTLLITGFLLLLSGGLHAESFMDIEGNCPPHVLCNSDSGSEDTGVDKEDDIDAIRDCSPFNPIAAECDAFWEELAEIDIVFCVGGAVPCPEDDDKPEDDDPGEDGEGGGEDGGGWVDWFTDWIAGDDPEGPGEENPETPGGEGPDFTIPTGDNDGTGGVFEQASKANASIVTSETKNNMIFYASDLKRKIKPRAIKRIKVNRPYKFANGAYKKSRITITGKTRLKVSFMGKDYLNVFSVWAKLDGIIDGKRASENWVLLFHEKNYVMINQNFAEKYTGIRFNSK